MARYAAPTVASHMADIDLVEVRSRALASAYSASAFMPIANSFQAETRSGILVQRGSKTWAAMNLDNTPGTPPDETVYDPTGRAYTCTGHGIDTVVGQYGLIDGNSSGDEVVNAIVSEVGVDYARYFDSLCAAIYLEAKTTTHEIGASTAALTGPLIDSGIEALVTSGAPENFAFVIHTTKISELMQIPGMRDKAIRGSAGPGGVDGPNLQGAKSKLLVSGWGGILDVYHSGEIVSSTGYHNMMVSVGNGTNEATIQNPWVPMVTADGQTGQKMNVDVEWKSGRRAIEVNPTTVEVVLGSGFTSTTNEFMVDVITA